ncbi:MAG: ribosome maturation factor RimP [Nitrospirales bacterium]|nr:ribosome maturation factor RimP [Nitrospirales bacterium]
MAVSEENVVRNIEEVATPIAKALGVELVEVKGHGRGTATIVRVTIDKPGGVGIDDCEHLHQSLSRALDVVDPGPHAYRLEVSSPGLDRPLKNRQDFQRALGKLVRITLLKPIRGEWVVVGRLSAVQDEDIILAVRTRSGEHDLSLPWNNLAKSKLEVEFS